MNVKHLQVGSRTIMTSDGVPMLVTLAMRPSTTVPSRIKAVLAVPLSDDNETVTGIVPMPFAVPVLAPPDEEPCGFTPEFRLEMN